MKLNRESVFLFAERFGQLLAIGIVNVIVLRQLGPGTYGYLGAATALLAILLPMGDFGRVPVIRALSIEGPQHESPRQLVRFGFLLATVGSGLGAAGMLVSAAVMPAGHTRNLVLVLSLAFVARPLWGHVAWYMASQRNHRAAVIRTVGIYSGAIGRVVVALTSQSLLLLALMLVLENVVSGLLLAIDYRRVRDPLPPEPVSAHTRRDIVSAGIPMLFSNFAVLVYMRADQPMLLWLSGSVDVGHYAAAANLSDALSFIPVVFSTIIMSAAFRLHSEDTQAFSAYMQRALGVTAGLGYVVLLCGLLLSEPLVRLLYGDRYAESAELLMVLLLSVPFIFSGVIQNVWIAAERLQRLELLHTTMAAVLNVGLNIILIPHFGALGAAWGTVLSHALANMLANVMHTSTRPILRAQLRAMEPVFALRCAWSFLRRRDGVRMDGRGQ